MHAGIFMKIVTPAEMSALNRDTHSRENDPELWVWPRMVGVKGTTVFSNNVLFREVYRRRFGDRLAVC